MKFSEMINEASSFKYGALNFTVKQPRGAFVLTAKSGPLECEILINLTTDEIYIEMSDYSEWFDTPQLKSLNKLLAEIKEDDIFNIDKLFDLMGIESDEED